VIGAKDSFFLFLHWLRSANPIDQITADFDLRSPTLYKDLHKLALAVHNRLVIKYITDLREQPLHVTGSHYRSYGLVVDTAVQKRGQPAEFSRKLGDTSVGNTGSIASSLRS
jgi:hypothetical protein